MTPEQQFIAAIADSIRAELLDQQGTFTPLLAGNNPLIITGYINIDQLAQAVHKTIIEYQAPNF